MAELVHSNCNCMAVFTSSDWKLPPFDASPVSSGILETNDPPLESQIPLLRDFVARGRARMEIVNAKIALLESALHKLLKERDELGLGIRKHGGALQSALSPLLKERHELDLGIRKHESALLPLRRMPTEILSHIFPMALQPSEPAPWTVSAVCARWRAIVVSQPRFWVSIHHSDRNRISSFRLETQLHRSAELPLNINFTAFSHRSAEIRDLGFRKLGIICKHAARWEILSMSGTELLFDQLKACVQDQLARLRELTIEMEYNRYDLGGDVPSLDVFSDAPLLQRVVANKLSWAWPVAMVLPWLQLLRYSGSNIWDGHLLALGSATNLVECSLEIQGTAGLPHAPISLPHLLRFSLSDPRFLECVDAPALVELCCNFSPPVLPFLRRQRCKLQSLIMSGCLTPADPTDLTHIVDAVPIVATLGLRFPLPAVFAHDFHSRPSMTPALECISVMLGDSPDVQNQFVQAIESRSQSGRLKSVKVHILEKFAPNILERIKLLRAQGMEFTVFDNGYFFFDDMYIKS